MTTNDTSGGQFTATTTPAKPGSRIAYAVLAAIVLLALWLRLYRLDALSLWYDEGATLVFSQGGYQNWIADNHPPLYYALMNGWRQFGQSEYWLRLLIEGKMVKYEITNYLEDIRSIINITTAIVKTTQKSLSK